MASREREPIIGGLGRSPQRDPGAQALVRGVVEGGKAPLLKLA